MDAQNGMTRGASGRSLLRRSVCGAIRFVLFHNPLKSGTARLSAHPLVRWSCEGLTVVATRLRNGLEIEVDARDYNGRMLLMSGTVDPKIVAVCRSLLEPGDVFFDVGANYGVVGLTCADRVGAGGEVHFFEPQKELCDRIRRAAAGISPTSCTIHECGLLDRDANLTLSTQESHSGASSLVRGGTERAGPVVAVRDASQLLPAILGTRRFGVKLDVEGAEGVLMPIIAAIPGLRFMLFESTRSPERDAAWSLSRQASLSLLGLERRALSLRLTCIDDRQQMDRYHDFLALPTDAAPGVGWRGHPRSLRRTMRST